MFKVLTPLHPFNFLTFAHLYLNTNLSIKTKDVEKSRKLKCLTQTYKKTLNLSYKLLSLITRIFMFKVDLV